MLTFKESKTRCQQTIWSGVPLYICNLQTELIVEKTCEDTLRKLYCWCLEMKFKWSNRENCQLLLLMLAQLDLEAELLSRMTSGTSDWLPHRHAFWWACSFVVLFLWFRRVLMCYWSPSPVFVASCVGHCAFAIFATLDLWRFIKLNKMMRVCICSYLHDCPAYCRVIVVAGLDRDDTLSASSSAERCGVWSVL